MPRIGKSDKDFQAEMDFDTLQDAAEIAQDKARLNRAIKAGEKKQAAATATLKRANGLRN